MSRSWGLFVIDIKPRKKHHVTREPLGIDKDYALQRDPYGNEAADDYMLRRAIAAADYNRRHEPFGSR